MTRIRNKNLTYFSLRRVEKNKMSPVGELSNVRPA